MKKQLSTATTSQKLLGSGKLGSCGVLLLITCLVFLFGTHDFIADAQTTSGDSAPDNVINGIVLSATGKPVNGAKIHLSRKDLVGLEEKTTGSDGKFVMAVSTLGEYSLSAEKEGQLSTAVVVAPATSKIRSQIKLVLDKQASTPDTTHPVSSAGIGAMQFADQPNFTVAGITDFTAVGGHGSDSTLRTSEALAVETLNLKESSHTAASTSGLSVGGGSNSTESRLKVAATNQSSSFEAKRALGEFYFHAGRYSEAVPWLQSAYEIKRHDRANEYDLALACRALGDLSHSKRYVQELLAQQESGDLDRLAGELDEGLGDPLTAVREYQKAVSLNPSEQNLFEWGSELLVHRAIREAQQVFQEASKRYPASSRILTGLGTAQFAGAAYEDAAINLCGASDLKPTETEPYLFLGRVQMAAPKRLACIEERLHRFVVEQPGSAVANYFYAMALQRQDGYGENMVSIKESEELLRSAIAIDPKYSDAYFQLGVLYASRRDFTQAIAFYTKAIAANPKMSDAHYRLAVAYDRIGEPEKAKEEFALHDTIATQQAAETERQRQEVKQFLVALPGDS